VNDNEGVMAASVRAHYDDHLGPIYGWMIGDFDRAVAAAGEELLAVGVAPGQGRSAVDLGAGLGAHALALAAMGYAVTAIDTCAGLLDELRAHARGHGHAVITVQADLLEMRRHCSGPHAVILCMGDTLTHLASVDAVERLFDDVAALLAPGGRFVATFRDYQERRGADRVIPVRQDDHRKLTCVLEYTEAAVVVHDVVHERTATGWSLRVSSYRKLRLAPEWVCAELDRRELTVRVEPGAMGMTRLVATRPA
jgi:2-polyprenyl-3-methyl-5-hydroxy-6-metoxy-1,4-benzoquinol methylase